MSPRPSPSTDPSALVQRLRVATATRTLPPDLADWLRDGLEDWLDGRSTTLCAALGLRTAGRNGRVGSVLAMEARNAALRVAAESMTGETETARCDALARAVRRFESDVWPRVAHLDEPPERFTEAQRALWVAFQAGRPPRSARGIRAALGQ